MSKSQMKTIFTVSFNSKGVIQEEFVPLKQMVNVVFYMELIKWLKERVMCIYQEITNMGT